MFEGKSFFTIIQMGGPMMYVLLGCSVISFAILLERIYYFRKQSFVKREPFMRRIRQEIEKGLPERAADIAKKTDAPFARIVRIGLLLAGENERVITKATEREIKVETVKLERFTTTMATIGSTAVYIGLLGTVLGIMRAFHDISRGDTSGINVVIGGIAEALVCTATGLLVAIPAVVAYNYFIREIDKFVVDMELCASETVDLLTAED